MAGTLQDAALGRPDARGSDATQPRRPFPAFGGAVPVLLYHRVAAGHGGYRVAPASFDAQLRRLHELGFQAITLDQFVRFARGEAVDLPQRPILLTFDDGYASAWKHADPLLARYGWTAAMYIATGLVGRPGFVTWAELREVQRSERWQIDEHAGDGHVLIAAGAAGRRLPFYASVHWANGRRERFAHYRRRVTRDVELASTTLAQRLPGWTGHGTFAVPFNNYGQNGSNDRRIAPWLGGYLTRRFAAVFVQRDDGFAVPGNVVANRIAVASGWDADALEGHLRRGLAQLKR
jgi:peptidoglycan/xylan/chitin deacetylase (PgdA/CDA1 family)